MSQHLTTVQQALREYLRLVEGVGMADPVDAGEELQRYPPGTSLTVVRRDLVRLAMASRGVDYSIDCFCHRGIWERFVSVRYEPGWEVDPATGIISGKPVESPTPGDAATIARDREIFEGERAKRQAAARRGKGGPSRAKGTAENH